MKERSDMPKVTQLKMKGLELETKTELLSMSAHMPSLSLFFSFLKNILFIYSIAIS
jgi:hypothetical protein